MKRKMERFLELWTMAVIVVFALLFFWWVWQVALGEADLTALGGAM